jgi:ribosomal protein L3 glutamine methyltransferase
MPERHLSRLNPRQPGDQPPDRSHDARAEVFVRAAPPTSTAAAQGLGTVRDLIRWACTCLSAAGASFGHGTDNAHDEATWLTLWALRLPLDKPEPFLDATVLPAERAMVADLIERRCQQRIPAAYLTGEAWLRGLRFLADRRALVPRSLLVEMLEEALSAWLPDTEPETVLDLCTGGGSIAIAAALHFADARVDATDLSGEALTLAAENRALYGLDARMTLFCGDLYEALAARRYDLILSNPPYVNAHSMAQLPAEFCHEPRGALAGGDDGMSLVTRILRGAAAHLQPEGVLVVEIGHEAEFFEAAFPTLEFGYVPVSAGERMIVAITRDALIAWAAR